MNVAVTASEYKRAEAGLNRLAASSAPVATKADDKALNSPCEAIGSNAIAASPTAIQPSPAACERTRADASTLRSACPAGGLDPRAGQVCARPAGPWMR